MQSVIAIGTIFATTILAWAILVIALPISATTDIEILKTHFVNPFTQSGAKRAENRRKSGGKRAGFCGSDRL